MARKKHAPSSQPVRQVEEDDGSSTAHYLRESVRPKSFESLLFFAIGYNFAVQDEWRTVFLLSLACALTVALRAKRAIVYASMAVLLTAFCGHYALSIATRPHDPGSDRDEAVEIASQAFLEGENPWARTTGVSGSITTGPASVLLAAPFVLTSGNIDGARLVFWLAFFGCLLSGDVRRRNRSFLGLGLLFLTGFLGFHHTIHWSLEELYVGHLLLVAAWATLIAGYPLAMGALVAVALMVRLAYAFPAFGLLVWWIFHAHPTPAALGRAGLGLVAGTFATALPFVLMGTPDLLARNPFTRASGMLGEALPSTNVLFDVANQVTSVFGSASGVARAALLCAGIAVSGWLLRERTPKHPFWHITGSSFGAMLLISGFGKPEDYMLFFAIPAFVAVSQSDSGWGGGV